MKIKNIILNGKLQSIHIYYYSESEKELLLNKFDGFIYKLYEYKRGNIMSLRMSNVTDKYRNYYVLKINEKEKDINKSRTMEKDLYNSVIELAKQKGIDRKWSNPEFKKMYCDKMVPNKKYTSHSLLVKCISNQIIKEEKKNIWKGSLYEDISKLESNNVGIVGETYLQELCDNSSILCEINGINTKQKGGGSGDGFIKSIDNTIEVKTARLGNGESTSFQHELGEYPWKARYMCFIDICPNCVYITIFNNFDEEFYKKSGKDKSFKCLPYFPTKTITQRKGGFNFKLDTTPTINEKNVKNGLSIKITDNCDCNFKYYINSIIQ
jgi:hypothetical protein